MKCPKCEKGSLTLVTETNNKMQGDKKGILYILAWPFIIIGKFFVLIFGKKEKANKKQVWRCSYCGSKFKADEFKEE